MAVFSYVGTIIGSGEIRKGTISSDSLRQARDQLRSQGLRVRQVNEKKASNSKSVLQSYLLRRQVPQVTGLLQEMATLLAAGIPLLEALETISRQHSGQFKQCIMLLRDHVSSGGSLAEAMVQQRGIFDELCINIVEVGENAGTLEQSLMKLVEFRRRNATIRNRVVSALIYPCIVMTVGIGVCIFLMTFVVPKLLGVLEDSGKALPFATQLVKGASDFLMHRWWLLIIAIALIVSAILAVLRNPKGRMVWHRFILKIPLIGDLSRKQSIARISMVMATLLKSDVPFVMAVKIAQGTVKNLVLRGALSACETAVMAGDDIAVALEKTDAFPPLVIQVFAVGQASGKLEQMLDNLAADYDTQVDITSARLTALLEPIMLILLAIMVGLIAFATIMPVLEAGDVL